MLRLTQLHGFNAVYREVDLEFTDSDNSQDIFSPASSPTFSDKAIGAAANDRYVYVVYGYRNDGAVSSVSIGGIAATEAVTGFNTNTTENIRVAIWYALVPTGTTATCVFTHTGGTVEKTSLAVYTARGVGNPALATDTDNEVISNVVNGGPFAVPPGAAVIAGTVWGENSSTSWTGLTEDSDMVPSAGDGQVSSASAEFRESDPSFSFSATFGLFENGALAAVVISPHTA